MSAFGALPLDPVKLNCTAFVSSANKCIEGVPGFGFVIARTDEIEKGAGQLRAAPEIDANGNKQPFKGDVKLLTSCPSCL